MNNQERIYTTADVELRAADDSPLIHGYAAVFDAPYETPYFREFIRPGAFTRALREKQDVRGLFNHDDNHILGRLSAGTLRLIEDQKGLRFEIDMPNRQDAKDLRESIKRGDITGCSFAFIARKQEWDESQKIPVRSLLDVDLIDVGPVTFPAYTDTTVAVRSLEAWRAEHNPKFSPRPLSLLAAQQRHASMLL